MFNSREILFRGFHKDPDGTHLILLDRKDNDDWDVNDMIKGNWTTWGFHCDNRLNEVVFNHPGVNIIPQTIGQFSGYYDGASWANLLPQEAEEFRLKCSREAGVYTDLETAKKLWRGHKIFEGDLLSDKNDPEVTGAVIFENGSFRLAIYRQHSILTKSGWVDKNPVLEEILPFDELVMTGFKVFGNVFEFPLPFLTL